MCRIGTAPSRLESMWCSPPDRDTHRSVRTSPWRQYNPKVRDMELTFLKITFKHTVANMFMLIYANSLPVLRINIACIKGRTLEELFSMQVWFVSLQYFKKLWHMCQHSPTHPLPHSPTHPPTHPLTHSVVVRLTWSRRTPPDSSTHSDRVRPCSRR